MMGFLRFIIRKCAVYFSLIVFLQLQNNKICSFADNSISVCNTEECQKLGTYYKNNMNQHAEPCDNFYNYVCHKWDKQNPKPKYEDAWTLELQMENHIMDKFKVLLEDKRVSPDPKVEDVKAAYRACMNLPNLELKNLVTVKNLMTNVGNWPIILPKSSDLNLTWWEIDNKYTLVAGESALFNYELSTDEKNKNRILTRLSSLTSPYGMLLRWEHWGIMSGRKNHYKTFLKKIIEAVSPNKYQSFKNSIDKDLDDVIKFRESLRQVIVSHNGDPISVTTVKKFQAWYDTLTLSQGTEKVYWLEKLRAMYKDSKDAYGSVIQNSAGIEVQKTYFSVLAQLLAKQSQRVVANHVHLYFAERHIPFTPSMEAELQQSFRNDPNRSGKIRYQRPRDYLCIDNIKMKSVMDRMFIEAYFPLKDRTEVNDMVSMSQDILTNQIMESTWLTNDAKSHSKDKVSFMKSSIGYADNAFGITRRPVGDVFKVDPMKAEAYYVPIQNSLYISAGFLQSPMYTSNTPFTVNFGSIVPTLGHEMYHAFGPAGIMLDKTGRQLSWSNSTIANYKKHVKCFQEQYNTQRKDEYKKYKLNWNVNVPSTLDEDIADVMGLKLAHRAFEHKLKEAKGVCQVLPGFQNFSCEKMFFIAFGNTLCASYTPAGEARILAMDKHSLQQIRLNGAVSNMKGFAAAFNCNSQAPLNRETRCDLWK